MGRIYIYTHTHTFTHTIKGVGYPGYAARRNDYGSEITPREQRAGSTFSGNQNETLRLYPL